MLGADVAYHVILRWCRSFKNRHATRRYRSLSSMRLAFKNTKTQGREVIYIPNFVSREQSFTELYGRAANIEKERVRRLYQSYVAFDLRKQRSLHQKQATYVIICNRPFVLRGACPLFGGFRNNAVAPRGISNDEVV